MTTHQRAMFCRDAKTALFHAFVLGPLELLAVAGIILWASAFIGMPGYDLAGSFLGDALTLWAVVQTCLVAAMTVPGILCFLSDPVGTRRAMWTLAASVFTLLPQVLCLIDALGVRLNAQPIPVVPGGLRYTVRVRPSIPELRFTAGVSPQLE